MVILLHSIQIVRNLSDFVTYPYMNFSVKVAW